MSTVPNSIGPDPVIAANQSPEAPEKPQRRSYRPLLASLLSGFIPGSGHILLGRGRKGHILVSLFILLLFCFWPLRLLRFYWGFLFLFISWIVLCVYAACSSLSASHLPVLARPTKWWLMIVIPITFLTLSIFGGGVTRASGFRSFRVPSTSMEDTIVPGDSIVTDTWHYHKHAPEHGDLIIFHTTDLFVVKRVIAVGGDTIEGHARQVFVNGELLNEPYVVHKLPLGDRPEMDTFGPVLVPAAHYFVMGDNRDVSLDSRFSEGYGCVDQKSIVGKPLYIFYSAADRSGRNF
jgi:signal peptidase I